MLLIHSPHVGMLDGEEDEAILCSTAERLDKSLLIAFRLHAAAGLAGRRLWLMPVFDLVVKRAVCPALEGVLVRVPTDVRTARGAPVGVSRLLGQRPGGQRAGACKRGRAEEG
eukprot:scaffold68984_cov21-Tisochrysis_lutea.AAC.1